MRHLAHAQTACSGRIKAGVYLPRQLQAGAEIASYDGKNSPMAYFMDSLFRKDMGSGALASVLVAIEAKADVVAEQSNAASLGISEPVICEQVSRPGSGIS